MESGSKECGGGGWWWCMLVVKDRGLGLCIALSFRGLLCISGRNFPNGCGLNVARDWSWIVKGAPRFVIF